MLIKTESFLKNGTHAGWIVYINEMRFPCEGCYDTSEGDAVYRALGESEKLLKEKKKKEDKKIENKD